MVEHVVGTATVATHESGFAKAIFGNEQRTAAERRTNLLEVAGQFLANLLAAAVPRADVLVPGGDVEQQRGVFLQVAVDAVAHGLGQPARV